MAYIDTNELFRCETCRRYKEDKCLAWCENGECYSPNMKKIPTADVVPKSEVDEIAEELSDTIVMKDELFDEVIKLRGELANAKAEVAREIFEEIEELAKIYTFPVVKNGVVEIAKEPFWCIEPNDLAKLKKKYTEKTE